MYESVRSLCARWSGLYIALKLPPNEEETIAKTHHGSPELCLQEVLKQWLCKNYEYQKHGCPSWQSLVQAVGDPVGGNHCALAETIGNKHPGRLKRIPCNCSLVTCYWPSKFLCVCICVCLSVSNGRLLFSD